MSALVLVLVQIAFVAGGVAGFFVSRRYSKHTGSTSAAELRALSSRIDSTLRALGLLTVASKGASPPNGGGVEVNLGPGRWTGG